jgi:hypothetical protein
MLPLTLKQIGTEAETRSDGVHDISWYMFLGLRCEAPKLEYLIVNLWHHHKHDQHVPGVKAENSYHQ